MAPVIEESHFFLNNSAFFYVIFGVIAFTFLKHTFSLPTFLPLFFLTYRG